MDAEEIRKLAITALSLDDVLYARLVFKGGNALSLIHGIGNRASLDLDYSISDDFDDIGEIERRIANALTSRFKEVNVVVLDLRMSKVPILRGEDNDPTWGGYVVTFKVVQQEIYDTFAGNIAQIRNRAIAVSPRQDKMLKISISKHEYVLDKEETLLEDCTLYVYTRELIAAEKLRAICQQMPTYSKPLRPRPRARDFYDIWAIAVAGVDLINLQFLRLLDAVFRQKEVPYEFLDGVGEFREFHRQDWPAVENAIAGSREPFDFYFDFVLDLVKRLKSLRVEEPPSL